MEFKNAIKNLRIELGVSQQELAEKLKVNRASIVRWEGGFSTPNKIATEKILSSMSHLNVSGECEEGIKRMLEEGRRRGTSAKEYGSDLIDQELLCQIVDGSANAVYAIDAETYKILYINRMTETLMEHSTYLKARNKTCYKEFQNRNTPCVECPLSNIRDDQFSEQIIKHFADERYLKVRGRKIRWNGRELYITYVTNVTELVKIRNSYEMLLETFPCGAGLYQIYTDGRIEQIYMNNKFYTMIGTTREQSPITKGFTTLQCVHRDDREEVREKIIEAVRTRQPVTIRYRIDIGNGVYKDMELKGTVAETDNESCMFNCAFNLVE